MFKKSSLIVLIILFLASCATKKTVTQVDDAGQTVTSESVSTPKKVEKKIEKTDKDKLADIAQSANLEPYAYYTIRWEADVQKSGISIPLRGTLKIIKDSVMVLSIQPFLGIEILSLYVDKNQVTVIDRFNRNYTQVDVAQVESQYLFNFNAMQGLCTNALYMPNDSSKMVSNQVADGNRFIEWSNSQYKTVFTLAQNAYLQSTYIVANNQTDYLMAEYSNFNALSIKNFPANMDFVIKKGGQEGSMKLRVTSIDCQSMPSCPLTIPSTYKKKVYKSLDIF